MSDGKYKKINPKTNTIFRGDNLEVMKSFPDECVDLIYIDPPFFTQRNYKNIWGDKESVADFENNFFDGFQDTKDFFERHIKSDAKGLKAYLEWMRARLVECHRILDSKGSFYLHLDYHAIHYVKVMLDEIFGYDNFRNEIIWKRCNNAKSQTKDRFGTNHDTILYYAKSKEALIYERPRGSYKQSTLDGMKDDGDGKGPYQTVNMIAAGCQLTPGRKEFEFKGIKAPWLYSKEKLIEFDRKGLLVETSGGKLRKKRFLSEMKGPELGTVWVDDDVAPLQGGTPEATGWPTQKPLALLERIIASSSEEGDIVFDCFAGCGTAMHAAHKLRRKWVGIDISPTAIKVNRDRLSVLGAKVEVIDERDLEIKLGFKDKKLSQKAA